MLKGLDVSQSMSYISISGTNFDKLNLTSIVKLIEKEAADLKSSVLLELCEHLKAKLLSLSELLKRKETENVNLKQKLTVVEKLNSNAVGIAEENEKLVLELEKLKNEHNIMKIELEETKLENLEKIRHNEIRNLGQEDLQKLNKQYECEIKNNWETIKELQMDVERKSKELEGFKKKLYFNVEHPIGQETKDEIIFSLKKEVEYLRGSSIHLVDNFLPDEKVKAIIDSVYSLKQPIRSAENIFEPISDSRVIDQSLLELRAENEELREELKNAVFQNQTFKQNLAECKYYLVACYDELESYKKKDIIKSKMENKEVYNNAIKNIDVLDEKLKSCYSHIIDLFMDLSKQRLVKVEKELNDCIIEYKEIKKIILE